MRYHQIFLFCGLLRGSLTLSPIQTTRIAKRLQNVRLFCANNKETPKESQTKKERDDGVELPEEPTNCCMSGCANCVWIEYAKQLKVIFCCSGDKTREIILEKIDDPNMKAFLAMELKMMEKDE